jgi:hypothetical protein
MKGVLPWFVRWARRDGPRDFLSCLGCSGQPSRKYFFLIPCPHRQEPWAGSRAGSLVPVSDSNLLASSGRKKVRSLRSAIFANIPRSSTYTVEKKGIL